MVDCEVCGKPDARIDAVIEGAKLRVCEGCAKLSKRIIYVEPVASRERKESRKAEAEVEIVDDYAVKIKTARERLGITRKELAAQIDEKESFLKHIEEGTASPPDMMARKLERNLKIKLFEEVTVESGGTAKRKSADVTLGDIVDVKKK